VLAEQAGAAREAIETLSRLSRGIYPPLLADEGLVPALRAAVAGSPVPVTVDAADAGAARMAGTVEAALYFCALEAVQNAAKHSGAAGVRVALSVDEDSGWAQLVVADDGTGFDPAGGPGAGAGLANMRDRLDDVGGTVSVLSEPGRGTTVRARVPVSGQSTPAMPGPRHGTA
jgi:signal transduction histidine kinase